MRMSQHWGRTLREAPGGVVSAGEQWLVRAGMVKPVAGGVYAVLPLGQAVLVRIEQKTRQTLDALGGQQVTLPEMCGAELWDNGALRHPLGTAFHLSDSAGRNLTLGSDAAAVLADLAIGEVRSYRQLPALLYSARRAWQAGGGRGGLLDTRETLIIESFGLAGDDAAARVQFDAHLSLYTDICAMAGVPTVCAHAGPLPDTRAGSPFLQPELALVYLTPHAGQTVMLCDQCGYTALAEAAQFAKPPAEREEQQPLTRVVTPHAKTIADLAQLLGVPESRTAKAVFLMARFGDAERFIFAVVRGDMDLNEAKLAAVLGAVSLRPATEAEIRATGATPGYASPIGLKDVTVIVDDAVAESPNLVAGANEEGYHLLNTNCGRDYTATQIADIAMARDGDGCPKCSGFLRAAQGAEVARLSRHFYKAAAGERPTYLDAQGRSQTAVLTAYRLDLLRLLACIAEEHRDEHGLVWPVAVAPCSVHLVLLGGAESEAEQLYADLRGAGLDVFFDDRNDSPGVKFNDADLIGIPVRLTIGKRSLQQGGVELKRRTETERAMTSLEEVLARVQAELAAAAPDQR